MTALKICPTCNAEYPANERFCPRDGTALRAQGGAAGDLVGSVIAERYHVIRKLGSGGMGTVYLAEHVKMGRKSAVKVMNPGMGQDADAISRFNREASNASRINHPNVAGIYDFGETPDGLIYLAMEYVEGEPLTSVIEAAGALPPQRAADITRQAAEALTVAHEMGIVHRDLKPDNIMLAKNRDGSDCVKVVDFGIAKAANSDAVQKVTKTGLVVGTPEYMSPEQLSGDKLDGRSDAYSLALVSFNMLTGKLPFPSETAQEAMIMRLTDRPKTLTDMKPDQAWTPGVQAVMDRALERDVKARYQSASEFGQALYDAVGEMPVQAEATAGTLVVDVNGTTTVPKTRLSASEAPPAPVKPSRRSPILVGGGVAAVLLVGGAVYATRQDDVTPLRDAVAAPTVTTPARDSVTNVQLAAPLPESPTRVAEATRQTPGYGTELRRLYNTVADSASADQAEKRLASYRSRSLTRSDSAAVALISGKAALLVKGFAQGCGIMKRIDASALTGEMKQDLLVALKDCEGP